MYEPDYYNGLAVALLLSIAAIHISLIGLELPLLLIFSVGFF